MKRIVQVSAGIVLGGLVLLLARYYAAQHIIESSARRAELSLQRTKQNLERSQERHRAEVEAREAKAAEEAQKNLEARCSVITADGRKLTCPNP